MSDKICPTPGKVSFSSHGDAYEYNKNRRWKNVKIYQCKCGKYHATKNHSKHWNDRKHTTAGKNWQ
jgi:hypothetical protein